MANNSAGRINFKLADVIDRVVKLLQFDDSKFPTKALGPEPYLNPKLLAAYRGDRKSFDDLTDMIAALH
jgi:hypothetical protein